MTLRISAYLGLVLALSAAYLSLVNVEIGAAYTLAACGILLPLLLIPIPREQFYVVLFAAGSVWLAYLIRPLILVPFQYMFAYGRVGELTNRLLVVALLQIGVYGAALVAGLALGLQHRARKSSSEDTHRDRRPLLLQLGPVLFMGLFAILAMKAVLLLGFGAGQKGVTQSSKVGFLLQFLPEELIYALCVLMLARYYRELGPIRRWGLYAILGGFALLVLLSGSKAFILRIGLAVFIYFLATRGDFRIRVSRAVLVSITAVLVITASFTIGVTVRNASRSGVGRVMALVEGIAESTGLVQADAFIAELGTVTQRFAGLDGLLVTDMARTPILQQVFSLQATARRIVARFVPYDRGADAMTSGRAVGIYYTGHPEDLPHAGGVGLFGSLQLMFGPGIPTILALALLGWMGGLYFSTTRRFGSYEARFFLQYIGAYAVIRWTMAGNFDRNVPEFVTQLVQLALYAGILKAIVTVMRRVDPPWVLPRPGDESEDLPR